MSSTNSQTNTAKEDKKEAPPKPAAEKPAPPKPEETLPAFEKELTDRIVTVSYTHLTLPTILLV